ncbi:zf-TFIIB domain-containing protein [Tamaricihabitans halophyticus]|uniref:TFIIB-type zinc ribbon-containing protein n=1 Tax=Tamaricihabitans halophyticus TaxID=1262583 RepID=UPI0010514AB6|nr:zf-TFIIB domain-containing protein [Tamaricihabitans halophyticus]
MICPKCQNLMKVVDRLGVHIEQCEGCRGIFLDRGELEQIANAENQHYAAAQPPPYQPEPGYPGQQAQPARPPQAPPPTRHYGRPDSPRPYYHGRPDSPPPHYGRGYGYPDSPHYGGHYRKRKKRSFLEELFD